MASRIASGLTVFAAYGVLMGIASANGCSSSGGNRDGGTTPTSSTTSSSSSSTSSGGATSSSSSSSGSGSGEDASACGCDLPSGATPIAPGGLIYNGGILSGTCPQTFTFDGVSNDLFGYTDGTNDSGIMDMARPPGCSGQNGCALHATGSGYTGYGAGVGLTLNMNQPFDAGTYTGLYVWLQGTTSGTRGQNFTALSNSVHVKLVGTAPDGGDLCNGNDYGAYCVIPEDAGSCFSLCTILLTPGGLMRDNYDAGTTPDCVDNVTNVTKIQFEFSSYTAPDASVADPPVSFDVAIGQVAFF